MSWLQPWRPTSTVIDEYRPLEVFGPFDQWLNGMEQSMREMFRGNGRKAANGMRLLPRADLAETDKDYLISLELPGMEEAEVDVRLSGNLLTVSGERKQKKEDKDKHYYRLETSYGAFERSFELPDDVRTEPDALKATFKHGILEIRVPKSEPRPAARITVKSV